MEFDACPVVVIARLGDAGAEQAKDLLTREFVRFPTTSIDKKHRRQHAPIPRLDIEIFRRNERNKHIIYRNIRKNFTLVVYDPSPEVPGTDGSPHVAKPQACMGGVRAWRRWHGPGACLVCPTRA